MSTLTAVDKTFTQIDSSRVIGWWANILKLKVGWILAHGSSASEGQRNFVALRPSLNPNISFFTKHSTL